MLHVLVPHARQVRNTDLMHVERTSRLPRPHLRRGIPLAPVPRAVADAVRRLRSKADVAELVSDAVQRKLCTVAQLSAELDDGGRRGSATPRRVLLDVRAGVRSAAEADARKLWRRSGLPEPWWNAHVHDAGGRLLGVVDAWWDDVALACEINSYEWHLAPEDYAREQEKLAGLTALGVIVLPTLPTRMRGRADEVLRELGSAYAAAQARPRPDVRARTVDLRRAWWSAPPAGRRGGARAGRR
jgi:histone H3/H4